MSGAASKSVTRDVLSWLRTQEDWDRWLRYGGHEKIARLKRGFDACKGHFKSVEPARSIDELRAQIAAERSRPEPPATRQGVEILAEPVQTLTGPGLRLRDLPEFDDTPVYDVEQSEAVRESNGISKTLLEILTRDTGLYVSPKVREKSQKEAETLLNQSHEIARRLESVGVPAYRKADFKLFRYFIHSREVAPVPNFRRIMLIPHVAAQVRRPVLKSLEAFLERHPFARMWTFTSGPRTRLCDIRKRAQWLHRRLSKLAEYLRGFGIEMVFRATELGSIETDTDSGSIQRDGDGTATFHVHAHCLVWSRVGFINPRKWEKILKKVWRFWGYHWDDGQSVKNARELCKYVTKPGEILTLSPEELAELSRQLYRLKLVCPMGSLSDEIKARKEAGKRLDRVPTPDGSVFREVRDWNRHGKRTRQEIDLEAGSKLGHDPDGMEMRVLARHAPGFAPGSNVREPWVMVCGVSWNEEPVRKHPLVAPMIEATVDEWRAGQAAAAAIRVHTCTPTVRPHQPEFAVSAEVEQRTRPPTPPVWLEEAET